MFKQPPFILLIAALALGALFVAMWIWQPRMFPHHLAHSAHKALKGALEMRGLSAPEDDDESVEATRCNALGNAPDGKCDKLNAPLDGSNEKNTAGMHECDRFRAAINARKKLQKEKFARAKCPAARVASREASAKRIEFIAADRLDDPVLVGGGAGMFLEHCPPSPRSAALGGCLAVEYSRNGEVSRAVPFRLLAIEAANILSKNNLHLSDKYYSYRQAFWPDVIVRSVSPYPGGDLLVHLRVSHPFPFGGGVARVAPDGQPRWFRKDYSRPWPHIIDDNLALVRSRRPQRITKTFLVSHKEKLKECEGGEWRADAINLIDGRGRLLDEIDLREALLESPYSILFDRDFNWCDNPAFTNSIHQLGAEVSGANNIAPGDIVASFPFLNAFGIISQNNRRLKELIRGNFIQQQGIRHLEKARFLMFDSDNSIYDSPRLLMFDLATGKETTLFPRDHTPTHLRPAVFATYRYTSMRIGMHLAVSPDRQRVLFGERKTGRAFELRLSDGRVLNIFRQLHDLSSIDDIPDPFRQRAWVFQSMVYEYANPF